MDSKRGRELYRFDMSLMERLATAGFPMSVINQQRRMRPAISALIRFVRHFTQDLGTHSFVPAILYILTCKITTSFSVILLFGDLPRMSSL